MPPKIERIPPPEPGIYPPSEMPAEKYHRLDAVGNSDIKVLIEQSPRHFKHTWDYGRQDTDAFRVGRLQHGLVLEPFAFNKHFAIAPEVNTRTKAGKAEFAKFKADNANREIVTRPEYNDAADRAQEVVSDPCARRFLANGEAEMTLVWKQGDIDCKARLDWLIRLRFILDYKTCLSANPRKLANSLADYGYHRQAAWYLVGAAAVGLGWLSFHFLFQEKSAPHDVVVVPALDEVVELGRQQNAKGLAELAECRATNVWGGYGRNGPVAVDLPQWYWRANQEYVDQEMVG